MESSVCPKNYRGTNCASATKLSQLWIYHLQCTQYQSRIKQIILLSVSQEHLRRVADRLTRYEKITSQTMPAIVTFWGKLADSLDADKLQRWSAQEPIIVLFVGMPVHEFNETWPSSPVCHIAMERQYNIQNFDEAHLLQNFTISPIKTICNFGVVTLESVLSSNGRLSLMPNQ
ncbi:hypothetical protein VPH35_104604 [Triticum aestivum]